MGDDAVRNFLEGDFAKALAYYDERARKSKRGFRLLSVYLILVSAGLTLIVALAPQTDPWRWTAGMLSASITVATALLAHFKYQENWLACRASWDALERERRMYQTGAGEYKSARDKGTQFVERVEAILCKETTEFYARHAMQEDRTRPPSEPSQTLTDKS